MHFNTPDAFISCSSSTAEHIEHVDFRPPGSPKDSKKQYTPSQDLPQYSGSELVRIDMDTDSNSESDFVQTANTQSDYDFVEVIDDIPVAQVVHFPVRRKLFSLVWAVLGLLGLLFLLVLGWYLHIKALVVTILYIAIVMPGCRRLFS
ncbi:hypothetical protein MPDQ_001928 [Monascus purpureus]|uniref:Uncharacterized protein n=1 Tax=Monascus purpureus TaxID=5098 RepID=A0A507QLJ5_MONPU|nr:hypothetical protein MPDQ_001928 [Monascus purpureus]BDD61125.1 hypothetical protein MAP00_006196 [Monascus purpureus]